MDMETAQSEEEQRVESCIGSINVRSVQVYGNCGVVIRWLGRIFAWFEFVGFGFSNKVRSMEGIMLVGDGTQIVL